MLEAKLENIEGSLSSKRSSRGSLDSGFFIYEGKLDAYGDRHVSVNGVRWPLLEAVIELEDQRGLIGAGELEFVSGNFVTGLMLLTGAEAGSEAPASDLLAMPSRTNGARTCLFFADDLPTIKSRYSQCLPYSKYRAQPVFSPEQRT